MIAVILAAGQGTRLRPLSYFIPKILLPVRGRPVLDYLLRNLEGLDLKNIYVVVSEHMQILEEYLEKTSMDNVVPVKGLGWETGGDLSLALEQINTEDDVVVMNGDLVTDIRISEVYESHEKRRPLSTISVFELNDPKEALRFGKITMEPDSRITEFSEKPASNGPMPALVNTGFYVLDRELVKRRHDYLLPRKFKLESEFFPRLSEEGQLYGKMSSVSFWWDVGTMDSYMEAEKFLINSKKIIPP